MRVDTKFFDIDRFVARSALTVLLALFFFALALSALLTYRPAYVPDVLRRYALQGFLLLSLLLLWKQGWRPKLHSFKRTLWTTVLIAGTYFGVLKIADFILGLSSEPLEGAISVTGNESLLLMGVVAPILEELFFRDLLLRVFFQAFGRFSLALVVGAAFFMIGHMSIYPGAFILGIVGGLIWYLSGSILPAIVFHSLSNLSWFFIPLYFPQIYRKLMEWHLLHQFYR